MNSLKSVNVEDLAARVVAYRALGINRELATQCMVELARRRAAGENFDYEDFIAKELAKIPQSSKPNSAPMVEQSMKMIAGFLKRP